MWMGRPGIGDGMNVDKQKTSADGTRDTMRRGVSTFSADAQPPGQQFLSQQYLCIHTVVGMGGSRQQREDIVSNMNRSEEDIVFVAYSGVLDSFHHNIIIENNRIHCRSPP